MNENCPAYVKKESISPKQASDLIKKAGGKVVLAHPVAYCYEDNYTRDDILQLVEDMDADGIESYYIYVDSKYNVKIEKIEKWNEFAMINNLEISIGSDFHNHDGIHPEVGFVGDNLIINDNKIDSIIKWLEK